MGKKYINLIYIIVVTISLLPIIENSSNSPNSLNLIQIKQPATVSVITPTSQEMKSDYYTIYGVCSSQVCKSPYGYCVDGKKCQ